MKCPATLLAVTALVVGAATPGGAAGKSELAARRESPAAFGRRCIPADCVAPPSHIPDMLGRRALSSGRLAALGATPDFHRGLLAQERSRANISGLYSQLPWRYIGPEGNRVIAVAGVPGDPLVYYA